MDGIRFYRADIKVDPAWGPDKQPIPGGKVLKDVLFIDYKLGSLHLDCKAEPEHLVRFKSEYSNFLESEAKEKSKQKAVPSITK